MKREEEFGQFGTPHSGRKSFFQRIRVYLILFSVAALIPAAYIGWSDFYVNVLERESPRIIIKEPPVGLGIDQLNVRFEVTDAESGLSEVFVRSEDNESLKELLHQTYSGEVRHSDTISIDLPGRESGLEEGDSTSIVVTVIDRSYWKNRKQLSLPLKIDFSRPVLAMITPNISGTIGGALVAFYRVTDNDETFSGIKLGQWFFPGFAAQKLDKDFESLPDVHFSFFSFPLGFQPGVDKLRLFARDDVGNIATADVPSTARPGDSGAREIKLSRETLEGAVENLYLEFLKLDSKLNSRDFAAPVPAQTGEELVRRFRLINEDYPALLEQSLKPLFARPKALRMWRGPFIRQSGSTIKSGFAESRHYVFEGLPAGDSVNHGIDFAVSPGTPVEAANDGIVIFADNFGLYGKTVIVDHGFGITSLYAHMAATTVSEGDRLQKGQSLGAAGSTGLTDGSVLHVEIRLYGTPVRPNDWWDPKWIGENIEDRVAEMKKQLGLKIFKPI